MVEGENLDVEKGEDEDYETKNCVKNKNNSKSCYVTKWSNFPSRYERISRKQLPSNIKVKKVRTVGPRNRNRGIISLNDANLLRDRSERKKVKFNPSAIALKRMKKKADVDKLEKGSLTI